MTALLIAAIIIVCVPALLLAWAMCRMAALSDESAREQRAGSGAKKKGAR